MRLSSVISFVLRRTRHVIIGYQDW